MMRPYIGSWKRLAIHGVAAVLFGAGHAGVAGHHAVEPRPAVGGLRVRRRHHRRVGRDRRPAARPPRVGRLLGVSPASWPAVVTFLWPSMTALALLVVIATWSLIIGGSQIALAISARKQVSGAGRSGSAAPCWCCSACCSSPTLATEPSASPGRSGGSPCCSAGLELWLAGRPGGGGRGRGGGGRRGGPGGPASGARRTNRRGPDPASTRQRPRRGPPQPTQRRSLRRSSTRAARLTPLISHREPRNDGAAVRDWRPVATTRSAPRMARDFLAAHRPASSPSQPSPQAAPRLG